MARWKYRTQKIAKNSPIGHHHATLSGCIFATKAPIPQYLLHASPQYGELGPLAAEIGSGVWGTPTNFNGFCILAALLQQRCSPEANQTLHNVWPSPGLLHNIYIFGGCCPLTEFCPVQNSLYIQVLRSPTLAALLHGTPAAAWYKEWNYTTFAEGATYIRLGGHQVGHWPTF